MIGTIFRIGYLNLKNGDSEIVLTLTVPLVFLSIFALIFDNGIGGGNTGKVKVVLVNEDDSAASVDLISSLGGDPALRIIRVKNASMIPVVLPLWILRSQKWMSVTGW